LRADPWITTSTAAYRGQTARGYKVIVLGGAGSLADEYNLFDPERIVLSAVNWRALATPSSRA
jgi:hypothetical protein